MTLVTKVVEYTPVGKGSKEKFPSVRIDTWNVEEGDVATLTSDALAFTSGDFKAVKDALETGLNSWKRFKDQPGADPIEKIVALMDKLGITAEQFINAQK